MFPAYRIYRSHRQSLVAVLFILLCSTSWAGIDISSDGKAFTCDKLKEQWKLTYALPFFAMCQDIANPYLADSVLQYHTKPNVGIVKVLLISIDNITKNTTLFSPDMSEPAFLVYLTSGSSDHAWLAMSSLFVFKNKSSSGKDGSGEIKVEILDDGQTKIPTTLSFPWVTVQTTSPELSLSAGLHFIAGDKSSGILTYSKKTYEQSPRYNYKVEGLKRGKNIGTSYEYCAKCFGSNRWGGADMDSLACMDGTPPTYYTCSCQDVVIIDTTLSFSFHVIDDSKIE
ncbi:MAG: hypothetical protein QS748_02465 [Candidatus Endonucleobacter bathymodioli]|uniref:Uncharacterized protein n=1 Tax=Candidatus Endonucleibacter bathymodioli TaxID=539814 RepID=A0AA90NKB5_9GAMM|nr:hypothetical protein [Candidatus Endonucleobacter bathymodioli]